MLFVLLVILIPVVSMPIVFAPPPPFEEFPNVSPDFNQQTNESYPPVDGPIDGGNDYYDKEQVNEVSSEQIQHLETKINDLEAKLEQYREIADAQTQNSDLRSPFWIIFASSLAIVQFLLIIGFLIYWYLKKDEEISPALLNYVAESKAKGYSHEQVREALLKGGYTSKQINLVLEKF